MASSEISLQWNGYQNYMISNLKALFHDERYADVTLVTEGECSKAHKVVLSACSSLFKNIFKQNACDHPIIVLHDVSSYTLRKLLSFIYNGEVCVSEDYLPILLNVADSLKINGLSVDNDKGYNYSVKSQLPAKQNWEETVPELTRDIKIEIEPDILTEDTIDIENNQQVLEETTPESESSDNVASRKLKTRKKLRKIKKSDENEACINERSPPNGKLNSVVENCSLMQKKDKKILKNCRKREFKQISNDTSKLEDSPKSKLTKETDSLPNNIDLNDMDNEKNMTKKCLFEKLINKSTDTLLLTEKSVESPETNAFCEEFCVAVPNEELYSSPTFPCPFCSRVYHSWGYRRRHVKSRHTTSKLSCKSCRILSGSQMEWYEHAIRVHDVPKAVARDGLVVMVEAHAVLASSPPSPASLIHHLKLDQCELGDEHV